VDILEIQRLLPHRYPFLMVDRVVEIVPDTVIRAYKNVSANDQFFQGHFPGHPVMPGVLIVEALAQAAALLSFKSVGLSDQSQVVYLAGLDAVRFRKPVVPGDRLDLEVTITKRRGGIWKMRGEAKVGGVLVAEAELMATLAPKNGPAVPGVV
jgi:3-hydroxyacyl-[acyl-carrier-protein] dehydratase